MSDEREDPPEDEQGGEAADDRQPRRTFLRNTGIATAGMLVGCGGGGGGATDGGSTGEAGRDAGGPLDAASDAGTDASGLDAGSDASRIEGGTDAGDDASTDPGPPPEDTPESIDFDLGVASGDVTEDSAMVWTRYEGVAPLTLVVWEMMGPSYARRVHEAPVTLADGGYAHVDVSSLSADERYRYAFFKVEDGRRIGRSPIGRFRSAPGASSAPDLTFGAVSCTDNGRSFDTLERAGERDDLDAFILLGDTTYNDSAHSLSEYRAKWAENLGTDGYRAVRRTTSLAATWDDHEVDNDWNPETFDAVELANARRAFFENLPLRRSASDASRIYKRLRWGRTAELFVLDCRGERLPSTRGDPDAQYISPEQMSWLKSGLASSTATFKIIVNSVPITCFPGAFDLGRGDRWEAYGAQRTEILTHIDDMGIEGVMWISGDFHLASRGQVSPDGEPGANQTELLCGPGAQLGNPAEPTLRWADEIEWSSRTNNYTTLELEPDRGVLRALWTDGGGSTFEVAEYRP